MNPAPVLVMCLVLSTQAQALTTQRIFASGFGSGEPLSDCAPGSITETVLESRFLRRTTIANACIPPNIGGPREYCFGNGCGGNQGCAVPLSPPSSATALLTSDLVAVAEGVGQLSVPFRTLGANCTMVINFTALATLRHGYSLQRAGLDGLTLISASGVLVDMPPNVQSVTGDFICAMLNSGIIGSVAADVVSDARIVIDEFETANAPQDAPGSTVCPITQ